MFNIIKEWISDYKNGKRCALPSYCTGNRRVIQAILNYYKNKQDFVLLEATANQVNQYGGYTGLQPADYKEMVLEVAKQVGMPAERILFGGDHLGPLVWCKEPQKKAMQEAVKLVELFVEAGYQKIHLDTSMKLGDDPVNQALSVETIAKRGAVLCEACEKAFSSLQKKNKEAIHPVYIIGSEVPIPGGASGEEEQSLRVTCTDDFLATVKAYEKEFKKQGIEDALKYIVGVVVQPGVEFANDNVTEFEPEKAKSLTAAIKQFPALVFEGHSTDYQTPYCLRQMVESGVFILKVGPALTFTYREALTGMEKILTEINGYKGFTVALLAAMNKNDKNWRNHYKINSKLAVYQKYSFSDRCRYYLGEKGVQDAISEMKNLFNKTEIPLFLVHQYLPLQYHKIRKKELFLSFDSIIDDMVACELDNYMFASGKLLKHEMFI